MENFLGKVVGATKLLGKAPYDDEKTRAVVSKATRKVVEEYYARRTKKEDQAFKNR